MNWWKRKQITHVLLLLLCIGLFSCTADPPVGGAEITAPEQYLNVNHYVETALHNDFLDFLPELGRLDPSADILRYHYEYRCAALGEPQFAISMQVEFCDDAAYQAERSRIMRLTGEPSDEVTVTWLKGSTEELAAYLDGEPQDGTRYVLACVQLDPVQKTVSYFAAQLYDGQKPLSAVSDILHGLGLNT